MPGEGAKPVVGAVGALEFVEEHRVELRVQDRSLAGDDLRKAIEELKKVRRVMLDLGRVAVMADTLVL